MLDLNIDIECRYSAVSFKGWVVGYSEKFNFCLRNLSDI